MNKYRVTFNCGIGMLCMFIEAYNENEAKLKFRSLINEQMNMSNNWDIHLQITK